MVTREKMKETIIKWSFGSSSRNESAIECLMRRLNEDTRAMSDNGWHMVDMCSPSEAVIACAWERESPGRF